MKTTTLLRRFLPAVAACAMGLSAAPASFAQFDPASGQWGKDDPADLRFMTWNVQDGICRTADKVEGLNNWCALARIVAAMKPDVLILQETADNSGNGTGSGVDSVANLTTTIGLFLRGGNDPFKPGTPAVTSWVQKYAPGYDLPYVFASVIDDGFNRNVICSKYPFADLNGDTKSQQSDTPFIIADLYSPGGSGGIRGFMFAEIDLPDGTYAGNLVVGNAHLKSGGTQDDKDDRLLAAKNVAYYLDHMWNGGGTATPDPRAKILDSPAATSILGAETPWVIGGDWNEDEQTNGRVGPAEWLTDAENMGGTDGTDRDRTDSAYDDARDPFNNSRATQSGSKLDYVAFQDSIATVRNIFIFNSATVSPSTLLPAELNGFPFGGGLASGNASDHRPIVADLVLPGATVIPPDVISIAPASGVLRGGTVVDVTGTDFDPAATVAFGGVPATVVSRTGDTVIRVQTPPGAGENSVVGVTVSQPTGSDTLSNAFTYTMNPIELVWSGDPTIGGSVTFTVYGPANRKVGFVLGNPGAYEKAGLVFCAAPPFTVKRLPNVLNTGPLGAATVTWVPAGAPMVTRNAQAAIKNGTVYIQTNCVSVMTQ